LAISEWDARQSHRLELTGRCRECLFTLQPHGFLLLNLLL
jgi:hypothetical protein